MEIEVARMAIAKELYLLRLNVAGMVLCAFMPLLPHVMESSLA